MKTVLRLVCALIALSGALRSAAADEDRAELSQAQPDISDVADLTAFMDATVGSFLDSKHVAGATVSVVKDGRMIFSKGYGYADAEKRIAVDPARSLFRIGSISKIFTATAALQLVEQGKLRLDQDVTEILSDVPISKSYPEPITLLHLFTHTAGFEDANFGRTTTTRQDAPPLADVLKDYFPQQVRKPGTFSAYSNHGTALVGRLVEVASGMDFHDYVEQHILAPLEMQHTTTRQPLPASLANDYAWGHTSGNAPLRKTGFLVVPIAPAGSVSSTAEDMAKFMIAHLQKGAYQGRRILREETAAMMQTRQFSFDPRLSGMAMQFYENFVNGERIVAHAGGIDYHESNMILLPERQLGLFISFNGPGSEMFALTQRFMDHYFPRREIRAKLADSVERIPRIVGDYVSNRKGHTNPSKAVLVLRGSAAPVIDLGNGIIGFRRSMWQETEPYVFDEIDGPDRLVFKVSPEDGTAYFGAAMSPYEVLTKLAWYERPDLHRGLATTLVATMILGLLWWLYAEARLALGYASTTRLEAISLRVFAIPSIIGVFAFIQLRTDFATISLTYPETLQLALNLNYLLYLLVPAVVTMAIMCWRKNACSTWFRMRYALLALACVSGLGWLSYWRLIGA